VSLTTEHHLMSCSRVLPLQSLKRSSDVWKAVAHVRVYPLRHTVWHWKYLWRPEIRKSGVKWNYCAGDMV